MKFVCFSIAIEFKGREILSYGKTSYKSYGWLFSYFFFDSILPTLCLGNMFLIAHVGAQWEYYTT